ncbi:MAG: hypothetical protein KKA36_09510 [Gammaproteobacteria bacterium]|nr:hypothetical protein [Gammaproteobacteria bacterium]MBU2479313.1 hypothetical protein [Gammaproteobacteria bacterium]
MINAGIIASALSGSFNAATVVGLAAGSYQFQIAGGDFLDSKCRQRGSITRLISFSDKSPEHNKAELQGSAL